MFKKRRFKNLFAELFCSNTYIYAISAVIELLVVGLTFKEHLHARLIGFFITSFLARPFGIYRDFLFIKLKGTSSSKIRAYLIDTLACLSFQTPCYLSNLAFNGADFEQLLRGALVFTLIAGIIGRPFGIYRKFIRSKLFKLDTIS